MILDDVMNLTDMDKRVPGGVYLCQVNERVSCGACCGLYNVADVSREALLAMLTFRTETFRLVPRNMEAVLKFKQTIKERESQARPFREFHHCPYIGLIGKNHSRVGCLLHPLAEGNNGVDLRGLSYYGGMACNGYFCPTCRSLPSAYKRIVRELSDDWYMYGLIITETKLLDAFFREAERRLNMPATKETILENEKRKDAVHQFMRLKLDWPFRTPTGNRLCNYFFEDQRYSKPPLDYTLIGSSPSRYDSILRELNSDIDSLETLQRAEEVLDTLFEQLN